MVKKTLRLKQSDILPDKDEVQVRFVDKSGLGRASRGSLENRYDYLYLGPSRSLTQVRPPKIPRKSGPEPRAPAQRLCV